MPNLRGSEWLIIILLVVLLFGSKRLPDAARSMGRSLRIFKAETKGLMEDGEQAKPAVTAQQAAAAPPAAVPPTAVPPTVAGSEPTAPTPTPEVGGALAPQPPNQA